MLQSLRAGLMRSIRSAATRDLGKRMASARLPAMKIWKNWSGYHRRNLVETKMHCFKLLGQRAMARTFDRQITELKVRAAILNRFSQIGTPNTVRVE